MTGPEHYREAERVLSAYRSPYDASEQGFDGWRRDDLMALAQVHATLALTAATITAGQQSDPARPPVTQGPQWDEAVTS